ncbi:aldehyde dehydrogenase [Spirosoma arcticum]
MENVSSNQRNYFNTNQTKPVAFRLAQLRKLRDILKDNETAVEEALFADFGKSAFETILAEQYPVYEELRNAIEQLSGWAAVKPKSTHQLSLPGKSYTMPEPLGVSLIIGPWNYPFQLTIAPVIAALAAGCTVVLKPSELTPHTSRLLAQLINSNFNPDYFTVVEGGIPETTELLTQQFDIIFFTGSVPVGKIVYQAAAQHLTPVVLELGGKSPVIVTADSNLAITVKRMVWAKLLNSGQTCIAPDYVYVHKSIEHEFLELVAREIKAADYQAANGNLVSIVNQRNTARIANLINPEKIYSGGSYDIQERFIEPTVLSGITWEDKVMQEEIFGPLLPVMTYDRIDEVIAAIKQRAKPLALYLFTNDEAIKQQVLSELSFGGGCVNDAVVHSLNNDFAFGGVGESGIGAYHGEAGFRAFSHYKNIVDREFTPDQDLKYSPYTAEKLAMLKSFV